MRKMWTVRDQFFFFLNIYVRVRSNLFRTCSISYRITLNRVSSKVGLAQNQTNANILCSWAVLCLCSFFFWKKGWSMEFPTKKPIKRQMRENKLTYYVRLALRKHQFNFRFVLEIATITWNSTLLFILFWAFSWNRHEFSTTEAQ